MAARPIRIAIIANAAQARKELNSIAGEASTLGGKLKSFGKTAGIAVGAGLAVAGAAAAKFGADSVKAASDAQQSLGATETVFGKFADTVVKRSNAAADAVGLSANEYRELANVVGASLTGAGVPLKKATDLTDQLNKRAADMAATFGGTTKEAIESVSSLLRGEADPIEKYGVSIKQSDVSARLAAQGLSGLTGEAKKQAEIQARLDLLMQKTAKTQGAFGRESDTLAHQQQVLGAKFENIKAKLGTALLPILTKAAAFVSDKVLPAFERWGSALGDKLGPVLDRVKQGVSDLMTRLQPVGDWFAAHPEAVKGVGIALGVAAVAAGAFALAMGLVALATSPITLVILAIAALGAGVALLWQRSETFRSAVMTIWPAIQSTVTAAVGAIRAVIQTFVTVGIALWQRFGGTILAFINSTMKNVGTVLRGAFQVLRGIFQVIKSALTGDWKGLWNGIKTIISGALNVVKGILGQAWNVIRTLTSLAWNGIKALVSAAWNGIKSAVTAGISAVVGFVKGLPGKIKSGLGDLGGLLKDAGKKVIQGLLDGIESMVGAVKDKLSAVTDLIPDWKGPPKRDSKLLTPAGRLIMQSLIRGFEAGEAGVKASLGKLTDAIRQSIDLKDNKREKKLEDALVGRLKRQYDALLANGRAQDAVNKKLAEGRKRLDDLRKAARDYAATVRDAVLASGNIANLGKNEDGSVTSISLIDDLSKQVEDAKRFQDLIAQLTEQGLNKTSLQNLLDAGVDGGLAAAQALADGGKAAVTEVNDLTAQLNLVGTQLGNSTADTMYGAGIQAAQGLVRGLEAQAKKLDAAAVRMANALVKAVKKALGIKSPSRVFKAVGGFVTKGLTLGLDDELVKKSGAQLAGSLTDGFGTPALEAFAAAQVRSESENRLTVTLTSQQVDQIQRGRSIQLDLDAYYRAGGRRAS